MPSGSLLNITGPEQSIENFFAFTLTNCLLLVVISSSIKTVSASSYGYPGYNDMRNCIREKVIMHHGSGT